jgi:hypothetical protein
MTVSTNSGRDVALSKRFRVHTFAIRKKRSITDAASPHDGFVTMATAAGFSDIAAIDS